MKICSAKNSVSKGTEARKHGAWWAGCMVICFDRAHMDRMLLRMHNTAMVDKEAGEGGRWAIVLSQDSGLETRKDMLRSSP